MLLQNTTILYRHLPTTKLYKPRSQSTVLLIEGCTFQLSCCTILCCHNKNHSRRCEGISISVSIYQIFLRTTMMAHFMYDVMWVVQPLLHNPHHIIQYLQSAAEAEWSREDAQGRSIHFHVTRVAFYQPQAARSRKSLAIMGAPT